MSRSQVCDDLPLQIKCSSLLAHCCMLLFAQLTACGHFRGNARVKLAISAFPSYDLALLRPTYRANSYIC
jgi:hypothetical protein